MKTESTNALGKTKSRNGKLNIFNKPFTLLLTVCLITGFLFSLTPAADAANWRTLCNYTEFDHPNTNYGLRVTVEEKYGVVTGNFHVGFYADGRVFASEWMSSIYTPNWGGFYIASKMFYGVGQRYRVDLYLQDGFGLAYFKVQKEYLITFMGNQFWVGLNNEAPLVDKWVNLYSMGCNYY